MTRLTLAAVLFFGSAAMACAAPPAVPTGAPSPATSATAAPDEPCVATSEDHVFPLPDVFEHDIADGVTLRFIGVLSAIPAKQRSSLLRAQAAPPAVHDRILAATAAACLAEETAYRAGRALILVVNRWDVGREDRRFPDFVDRVTLAIAALAVRTRVDPPDLAAGLAPFGLRLADLETAAPDVANDCQKPDVAARVEQLYTPPYPESARDMRTTGDILVKVTLDDEGFVRRASAFKADGRGLRLDDLTQMTLFAAAATTYRPAISHCRPSGGTYIFRADYRAGR